MRRMSEYKCKFLLAIILFVAIPSFAQKNIIIDSIYYDSKWRGVPDKALASYMRVIFTPKDTTSKKEFKDYYITGELQGKGKFIYIDKYNDENSIFEGECISYYKSGKIHEKLFFSNGKMNGISTIYDENEKIISELIMRNDSIVGGWEYSKNNKDYTPTHICGQKFGNSYKQVEDGLKNRFGEKSTLSNNNIIKYYDVMVGGFHFNSASFYFQYNKSGMSYLNEAVFEEPFEDLNIAKENIQHIVQSFSEKYPDIEKLSDKNDEIVFRCGGNESKYHIIIELIKSKSEGGKYYYYNIISYGGFDYVGNSGDF